jgi:hypothetical protein
MTLRLRYLGIVLALFGLAFVAAGGYAVIRAQDGVKSLNAYSAAQNVKLTYNDQGQLTDRGETAQAQEIMSLLKNDWGYPVVDGDLNPNDPIVNTASEYMYQMATISFHTLHGTQTVTLPEDVTAADGTVYKAGTYEFKVDGRYWSAFDRNNPIEAKAREMAWTGTAHALIANLGVGTVTASALQMGFGLAGLFAGMGIFALFAGLGLVWAPGVAPEKAPKPAFQPTPIPA